MERIVDVAQYVCDYYKKKTGDLIDEVKLYQLLYLIQREWYIVYRQPLFEEDFEAWSYGPVSKEVRSCFDCNLGILCVTRDILSEEYIYRINNLLKSYGYLDSWYLRDLIYDQIAWKNAQERVRNNQRGNRIIKKEDIFTDAYKINPIHFRNE